MKELIIDDVVYTEEDMDLIDKLHYNKNGLSGDLKELVLKELAEFYKEPVRELDLTELKDEYLDQKKYDTCDNTVEETKHFFIEPRPYFEDEDGFGKYHLYITAKEYDEDLEDFVGTGRCLLWAICSSDEEREDLM